MYPHTYIQSTICLFLSLQENDEKYLNQVGFKMSSSGKLKLSSLSKVRNYLGHVYINLMIHSAKGAHALVIQTISQWGQLRMSMGAKYPTKRQIWSQKNLFWAFSFNFKRIWFKFKIPVFGNSWFANLDWWDKILKMMVVWIEFQRQHLHL